MSKFGIAPGPSRARRKIATAFAAAGALLLSSGMVVLAAAPASADNTVGICHATGSDTNPYLFKWVDQNSTDEEGHGHGSHFTDPQATWGNQGAWWNEVWYPPNAEKPDLLNRTQEFCEARGSKGPEMVTPGVDFVDPKCNIELAIQYERDDAVVYSVSGVEAPGSAVTVTAAPEPGYAFPRNAPTTWSHTFGLPPTSCDGVLNPLSPSLTLPRCDGPGKPIALVWTLPTGPVGIEYGTPVETATSFSVTATITDGVSVLPPQDEMPRFWTRDSDTTATYSRTFTDPGDCFEPVAVLEPYATDNTCTVAGGLVLPLPESGGYSWTGATNGAGPGTYDVTAVADPGYTLTGTADYRVVVRAAGDGLTCPGGGTPNVPVETPDVDTLVTPLAPSASDANCSRDGRLVVPAQPAGVEVEQDGTAPGDVTFTFTPAPGYAFPAGTDTEVTVTVPEQLTGDDCIQGVETSRPKPQPGTNAPGNDGPAAAPANAGNDAEVLGEQAVAVPTAVAAGIGDTMTTSTTGSPQLAQALVAAGLLMLVAGGATGLGRRTRGAHES